VQVPWLAISGRRQQLRRSINATSDPAEGGAGHILRVDENMSMDVDQPRRHQPAFDGHGAACFRGRQRGPDRDDLATGDPDVYDSSEPRGGIEHFAAGK
jgi:hypothetical protein